MDSEEMKCAVCEKECSELHAYKIYDTRNLKWLCVECLEEMFDVEKS